MAGWNVADLDLRYEVLFGERVVRCHANRPPSVHALLMDAVERAPEAEALVDGERRLTWRALQRIVEETAAGLAVNGIGRGDRVALLVGNRAEFVIGLYAIARLGAVLVPIGIREQAPGVAHILNHSGTRLLVHDKALADRLPNRAEIPGVEQIVELPADASGDPFVMLRSRNAVPRVDADEQDVAAILYTSGTTGRPKGAMVTHINLVHAAMIYERTMALRTGDRSVAAVPLSHVTGISGLIATVARCAGTLVIMPEFRATQFLALADRERMTFTILVPAMYNLCVLQADLGSYQLRSWRIGAYGGAPMPASLIDRLTRAQPNLRLMNLYGSTETVAAQAIMPPADTAEHCDAVGLAAPGGEVLIMDESGRECSTGELGEIWMRNASVVRGYWNDPDATAKSFVAGFWRSGDLGLIDRDGFIHVLDRIKDMINRGGYKVFSAEVESVLAEHPAVLECAIVAKPCPVLGERVHAFVVLHSAVTERELGDFCAGRLADYKLPESFTLSREPLPRNANGKVLKREIRSSLLAESRLSPAQSSQ